MNKLVQKEAFIDCIKVKSAEFKNKFLLPVFTVFTTANFHAVGRVVREFEMARKFDSLRH